MLGRGRVREDQYGPIPVALVTPGIPPPTHTHTQPPPPCMHAQPGTHLWRRRWSMLSGEALASSPSASIWCWDSTNGQTTRWLQHLP